MNRTTTSRSLLQKHSLSLPALGVVVLLLALYTSSNPSTHLGSFFGNAIADWTGVFVTVLMTKHLYEKGSAESKKPHCVNGKPCGDTCIAKDKVCHQ